MGPEKIRNDKVDRKWQNNAYEKGICGRRVLIEPYWNVKTNEKVLKKTVFTVLIEPYWNVKKRLYVIMEIMIFGINRTILECKDIRL